MISIFIENLIRLGRPMVDGGLSPREIIKHLTDVENPRAKPFFENVFVVEIADEKVDIHPHSVWGGYRKKSPRSKKQEFFPDDKRILAAPLSIPYGGNPTKPQGRYAAAVYIFYNSQFKKFVETEEEILKFLEGRIKRTIGISIDTDILNCIAKKLHQGIQELDLVKKNNIKGMIVIADVKGNSPYFLIDKNVQLDESSYSFVTQSLTEKDKKIAINLKAVIDNLWIAKAEEGAEKGKKENGECFFCRQHGQVVSGYNKASPWLTTTWRAPFPLGKSETELVESIALCNKCYGALTYGAKTFSNLTKSIDRWLLNEIFTPSIISKGKKNSSKTKVFGSVFVLPVVDDFFECKFEKEVFVQGLRGMMLHDQDNGAEIHLDTITGFEAILPESLNSENFRMTIMYYTGDISKGDIHLLGYIEDVLPSTVTKLLEITMGTAQYAISIYNICFDNFSESRMAFITSKYSTLPFLLSKAYGYEYLWNSMELTLHRKKLDIKRFIKNAVLRFEQLSKDIDKNLYKIQDEAVFLLVFKHFLKKYFNLIGFFGGENMQEASVLIKMVNESQPEQINIKDVEDLGFLSGCLISKFSKQYYAKTRPSKEGKGKEFIKHRLMTFGSSLTPEVVWKRGLSKIQEIALKMNMNISEDYRRKLGVLLEQYSLHRKVIEKNKDEFMAAFWAGYALYRG